MFQIPENKRNKALVPHRNGNLPVKQADNGGNQTAESQSSVADEIK